MKIKAKVCLAQQFSDLLLVSERRDSRIENTRNLAVAFANTVTATTAGENEWIARKKEATLFRILQEIPPSGEESTYCREEFLSM